MLRFDDEVCVLQVGVRPCFLLYLSEKKQHIIDKFTISECSEALHRSFAPKETWMFLAGLFFYSSRELIFHIPNKCVILNA